MITVPEDFILDTVAREGTAGQEWIDALPGLVDALCARWDLAIDGRAMHGYLSLVVPVRRGNELCALKITWIDEAYTGEAVALATWNGHGAVRLLAIEPSQNAKLLERLDFSRSLDDLGIEETLIVSGRLLRRLAVQAPAGIRLLPNVAGEIATKLPQDWERYGRPMPRRLLDQARDLATELGGQCIATLLVNFDLHSRNVLASQREPWLAVDPKVVAGDPEYGIAQLLWTRLEDIEANGGLDRQFPILVEAAELDPPLARAWTLVRCVDYWLWGLSVRLTYDPARCVRIISWLIQV